MSEEEINELKKMLQKLKEIRNELKEDATNSVKATFIVDALVKAENVQVSDQEVMQVIYYEANANGTKSSRSVKTISRSWIFTSY